MVNMAVILIVDDDKNQRLLYEQELNFEGCEVITAANGKEALNKVQWRHPEIIVMDINMPNMDGLEAIGKIIGKSANTPIVIHTAYKQYKDNLMSWAADSYLVKSSNLTELKRTIDELLTKKSVAVPIKI